MFLYLQQAFSMKINLFWGIISMPLHGDEVKRGLKMTDFTIHNAIERLRSEGDVFKPVLGKGINLDKAIKNFQKNNHADE